MTAWGWGQTGEEISKERAQAQRKKKYTRKLSDVMNVLITLILMLISWVYIYIKAY